MKNNVRQIDTGIGLIVGGLVGYTQSEWYVWAILFFILGCWGFIQNEN